MKRVKTPTVVKKDALPGIGAPVREEITIRPLSTYEDFRACLALQKQTWGDQFAECVPPTILKVAQRIGGIAAGAFDGNGQMLGFVFGISGMERGEPVHWSDMLAVRPEARNLGLGRRLKEFQANALRAEGIKRIYWTFDPLVARNAHLNINKLGVRVVEYVPEMYGDTDSDLHRIGTDRFIVAWHIDEDAGSDDGGRPEAAAALRARAEHTPILNAMAGDGGVSDLSAPLVRVEVPLNIGAIQAASLEEAASWRETTRGAFVPAMEQGYEVIGFYRATEQGPCYYVLTSALNSQEEED